MKEKTRTCGICGKQVEVDCWYSDYGLVKLNNSGELFVEFDACQDCLKKLVTLIKNELKHKEEKS